MAGGGDIMAGRAFVELFAKNNLTRTMRNSLALAEADSKASAARMTAIMGGVTGGVAIAAAAGAGIAAAIREFANAGSELNDMSIRTGASAEQLQHWTFAANQSGASAQDLEAALRKAAKNGIGPAEFEALGKSIASNVDPAERAAQAMEYFGKSGTKLLPMFSDLNNLTAQSKQLGPILNADQVAAADALGDSFGALMESSKRMVQQVGAALGPHLIKPIQTAIGMITALHDAVTGSGTEFSGDLLDRLAQFRRTSVEDFQKRGAGASAQFSASKGHGGVGEDDGASEEKKAKGLKTQDDIVKSIIRGEQQRLALINEFATPQERFLQKLQQINQALIEVNRNRVLGFISPQQAAAERAALETAQRRAMAAEQERRAQLAAKGLPKDKKEAKEAEKEKPKRMFEASEATTSAGLAMALSRSSGNTVPNQTLAEMKAMRREAYNHAKMIERAAQKRLS